jgi:methylisocitrate lyase
LDINTGWGNAFMIGRTIREMVRAGAAGVSLILYPLSAFRAMSGAAFRVYRAIREEGRQRGIVDIMQTRAELYDILGYHNYERKLDELFGDKKEGER